MLKNKSSDLIAKFKKTLTGRSKSKNENEIQKFLEKHTELIPLPFILNHRLHMNAVISKFRIAEHLVADFAFLTKCSDFWHLVLVELEASNKRIFTKAGQKIVFHNEFNKAYDQILSWRSYILDYQNFVKQKISCLLMPPKMGINPIRFKYVLLIGRNKEKNTSTKSKLFAQKNSDDIRVMTYDSLISNYNSEYSAQKIILAHHGEGFKIKTLTDVDTYMFAYLGPDHLHITKTDKAKLIKRNYDISSWERGELLVICDRYPARKIKLVLSRIANVSKGR